MTDQPHEIDITSGSDQVYDGFISYSHAADGLLAPRLQAGLQRFAKPWWKRRAVRIFRDESSLSANPHLWSSITDALDTSGWFVLLLSPDAASSEWVNQEIAYWKTNRDPSRILPVVTDGEFGWADGEVSGNAVPEALQSVFAEEPRWVDLRFARDEEQLDLKNPRFSAAVADIASALRGVPKDELESEEVRQHRRTVRTAWAAGGLVTVLAIAAVGFGIQSASNADEAQRQAQLAFARELAASAVNVLEADPELAILLTLEAIEQTPGGIDQPVEVINALWEAVRQDRLAHVIDTGAGGLVGIALSADGSVLAVSSANDSTLRLYSLPEGRGLWSYSEQTSDTFGEPFISPDGEKVAVGIWDSTGPLGAPTAGNPSDGIPARVVFLDRAGSVITRVEYPECTSPVARGWSPQGYYFAVSHFDSCPREGVSDGSWVEVLNGETFDQIHLIDVMENFSPLARFDQEENLYVFGSDERRGVEIYLRPDFSLSRIAEGITGIGDVNLDGSLAVTFDPGGGGFAIYDMLSGERKDRLTPGPDFPRAPYGGPAFSPDGSQVLMATSSSNTFIWDVGTGERTFHLRGGPGTNAAMSPDGKRLYTGHNDGTVKVWNLGPEGGLQSAGDLGRFGWINSNAFSIGPELGAALAFDISVFDSWMLFFDRVTGSFRGDPIAAWSTPAVPLADNRFALRKLSGEWIVYDPFTGSEQYLAGCPSDTNAIACTDTGEQVPDVTVRASTDRSELAVSVDKSPMTLVDPDTGSSIGPLAPGVDELQIDVFSSDWLAGFSTSEGRLVVVDRLTGDELARPAVPVFQRWEVSESGRLIAIMEEGESGVMVLDTGTWQARSVKLELGLIRGLSISPDENRVALGDESGLHIVDLDTGSIEMSVPLGSVSDIHWFDTNTVLVGGTTGIWLRISLNTNELVSLAREGLTRGFTPAECDTYRIDPCPTLEEMRGD